MNSVSFKINAPVLDFILEHNTKYNFFIPSDFEHHLSLKFPLTNKEFKELSAFNSRKFLEQSVLGLATIYKYVPSFYLPVRLDYRVRLYCVSQYLNYQGIDLAKSLLEFSIGEKIYLTDDRSISYLKIFGANSYGNKIEKLL